MINFNKKTMNTSLTKSKVSVAPGGCCCCCTCCCCCCVTTNVVNGNGNTINTTNTPNTGTKQ